MRLLTPPRRWKLIETVREKFSWRDCASILCYLQIDTINVIERCHNHILWSRIPEYRREHLRQAQTLDKTVFEYWTHALSYVPTRDLRFFLLEMKRHRRSTKNWFSSVTKEDLRKVLALIHKDGALSIRDIEDDVLVEKDHPWAGRKPSKRALQLAFLTGALTVSERSGIGSVSIARRSPSSSSLLSAS